MVDGAVGLFVEVHDTPSTVFLSPINDVLWFALSSLTKAGIRVVTLITMIALVEHLSSLVLLPCFMLHILYQTFFLNLTLDHNC